MLEFDATRPPARPREAATVIVVRGADAGIEVFCVERHPKSGFLGGALVFPGGKLDPSDESSAWDAIVTEPNERALAFADGADARRARALAIAGCRELLEEGGILPVAGDALAPNDVAAVRVSLTSGTALHVALAERGARVDLARLVPFARWITPEAEARRFDARFYLLELPAGQLGDHDDHETTTSFWATPRDVLARWERGEVLLAPPTIRALELLGAVGSPAEAASLAARQCLEPICPVFVANDDAPFLALPGDPAHPIRDRRVEGASRFVLRGTRFVSEDPPTR